MPIHWHVDDTIGCESVRCLAGHIRVYRANERTGCDYFISAGRSVVFKPGEVVTWLCSRRPHDQSTYTCTEDWSVELVVTDQNLYRNVSINFGPS